MDVRGVLPPGSRLRSYEIVSVLGHGGFGITYRARDTTLGRDVAIKEYLPTSLALRENNTTVLPRSSELAEEFVWGRDRFLDEARTLARLDNVPAVIRVFDFLEANGTAYMVMALVEGETLDAVLQRDGFLRAPAVERLLHPLLDGLEQVHAAGFLHRDIKPANIIVDARGNPTLIDFGASRAAIAGRATALTAIFTPGYAAAEQFTAARQGPWTDIYGLAATVYHAVTGHTPPNAIDRMLDDDYESLARLQPPGFAGGLLAGIDAGLAVRATDRPRSIADWRPLLRGEATADAGATVIMRPSSRERASVPRPGTPVSGTPARRRLAFYAGLAVAALIVVAGGGYFVLAPKPAPQVTALQDLKVEDLERVLAERRAADAAAAEKKRLEEEARRKVETDAVAKREADAELLRAQQKLQAAEQELAQLKAATEKRRQEEAGQQSETDAAAKRVADEAAQRKAETEMAALRQAQAEAQRKAEAEAAANRQAQEELAKAQAERQKADAEARQKADAEAAAMTEKKSAEAAEAGLRLTMTDRQRLQVALTSLGFDTRGSDGAFGPRSREMIAGWQKARNQPTTGFLTGPQHQALLREAAPALAKYDEAQKKIEDDKKAEEEAKAKLAAAPAATPAAPVAAPTPAQPASPAAAHDGTYGGVYSAPGRSRPMTIRVAASSGNGTYTNPRCGDGTVSIQISPAGDISGGGLGFDQLCGRLPLSVRGRAANGQIQLTFSGPGGTGGVATLVRDAAAPVLNQPAPSTPPPGR